MGDKISFLRKWWTEGMHAGMFCEQKEGWGQNKAEISWTISLEEQTICVQQKENRQTIQLTKN